MSLWRHPERWGAPAGAEVSLGEGDTPLVRSRRLGAALGLEQLWFKLEGGNPTGSYKDRFASAAVSHLVAAGRRLCLGTSSGNTGAAVAAYCARAGIACHLAIVEGAPEGKLRQMRAYGARLLRIRDFGSSPVVNDAVLGGLQALAAELGAGYEVSAYCFSPRGMAGVETIGWEITEAFPAGGFDVYAPAGAGGLTLALARGVAAAGARGRVHCVQPEGNDTIASVLRAGGDRAVPVRSLTAVSGLQVGSVLDGHEVIAACRRLGGTGFTVADEAVWDWQLRLAREEGIFAEPAGAVPLAGLADAVRRREVDPRRPAVCVVTGVGFKDERALARMAGEDPTPRVDDFVAFSDAVRTELARD